MKRNSTRTTLSLAVSAAVLWCLFGFVATAESDKPEVKANGETQSKAGDKQLLSQEAAAIRKALEDEQVALDLADAIEPLLQDSPAGQQKPADRESKRRLRSLGAAVNADLKSVAARIGRLDQSYRIPALKINGNGVDATTHTDHVDDGGNPDIRNVPVQSRAIVDGESLSELQKLRQEVQSLSHEVARLRDLVE
jgi:hypothetical protein